jgi:C1A family cysteine protease
LGIPLEVFQKLPEPDNLHTITSPTDLDYPKEIDCRNFHGKDWTTPIRDQLGCASCSAFGTIAAIESRLEIAIKNPDLNLDLSEGHPFFCGCGNCCGSGWFGETTLDFARDIGIVREDCFPYLGYYQPCELCANWQNQVTRISEWYWTKDIALMKWELAHHGPIITCIHVRDDFYSYTGGIYRYTWGESRGGHMIALVGYNEDEQYWIGKNSWGTDWGEVGWFRIAYGDSMVEHHIHILIIESTHIFFPIVENQ